MVNGFLLLAMTLSSLHSVTLISLQLRPQMPLMVYHQGKRAMRGGLDYANVEEYVKEKLICGPKMFADLSCEMPSTTRAVSLLRKPVKVTDHMLPGDKGQLVLVRDYHTQKAIPPRYFDTVETIKRMTTLGMQPAHSVTSVTSPVYQKGLKYVPSTNLNCGHSSSFATWQEP